jgi:hypothetical protein
LLNIPLKKEKENVKQKKNRGRKCVWVCVCKFVCFKFVGGVRVSEIKMCDV